MPKNTTKHARTAERIAALLADPETPDIISDVLTDMILDLSGRTDIDLRTPEVARVALPLMLEKAAEKGLRQMNGIPMTEDELRGGAVH